MDNGGDALCADGNLCTADACLGEAGCRHTLCDDGNACTASICDGSGGCTPTLANLDTTGFSADRVDGWDLEVLARAWNSCPGDSRYDLAANLDLVSTPPGACIGDTDFHLFMTTFGNDCP